MEENPNPLKRINIKHYMIIFLCILTIVGLVRQEDWYVLLQSALAIGSAILIDFLIVYIKRKEPYFSESAVITGLIIALVLGTRQQWYLPIIASCIAIIVKHLVRINDKHIFNPASSGLVAVGLIFKAYDSWWVSAGWVAIALVILLGLIIIYRTKKIWVAFSYFIVFNILFLVLAVLKHQYILNYFLINNFFFMLFILIEPKTSPFTVRGGVFFGIFSAILAFVFFLIIPQYDFILISLLIMNLLAQYFNTNKFFRSKVLF